MNGKQVVPHDIPDIVISRLPLYLRALNHIANNGQKSNTSSHELGQRLGISSAQIRKDLSHFGEFGKQGTGYHIQYLVDQLSQILNLENEWPVLLVGAGFLGHALASYQGFQHRGFRVAWVFDSDASKVGKVVADLPVRHMDEIEQVVKEENAQIAILAVPAIAAQETADVLVKHGIKAILNYAPINLKVPEHVQVRYSDPVVQMQRMSFYLSED